MVDEGARFATARMAAGVLFLRHDEAVLLVRPAYKRGWDLPGGYVEPGESPLAAAQRELREELGMNWSGGGLLLVDWAPSDADGDKLLFVFHGVSAPSLQTLDLQSDELLEVEYVALDHLDDRLDSRLRPRVKSAVESAFKSEVTTRYAEYGTRIIDRKP